MGRVVAMGSAGRPAGSRRRPGDDFIQGPSLHTRGLSNVVAA